MKKKAAPSYSKPRPSALRPVDRKQRSQAVETKTPAVVDAAGLLSDLRSLIQSARQRIAMVAYSTQTLLCWHVGRRLLNENLQGGRAAYGKQILVTVSRELTAEYGRGFSYAEIARMIQFAQLFPDEAIVVTLSQQLSWSHVHALLPIKDQMELLQLDAKSIRVSEYLTELPPLPLLRARLHQAMEHAREQAVKRLPNPESRQ